MTRSVPPRTRVVANVCRKKLAATLAGPDQSAEEYLEKTGRLNMACLQAEVPLLKG